MHVAHDVVISPRRVVYVCTCALHCTTCTSFLSFLANGTQDVYRITPHLGPLKRGDNYYDTMSSSPNTVVSWALQVWIPPSRGYPRWYTCYYYLVSSTRDTVHHLVSIHSKYVVCSECSLSSHIPSPRCLASKWALLLAPNPKRGQLVLRDRIKVPRSYLGLPVVVYVVGRPSIHERW